MIIVLDTETTGREPPEVIELAHMQLIPPDFGSGSESIQRFKPTFGSSFGALAAHHILDKELEECPPSMTAHLPGGIEYIVGHNVDYDWKALGSPAVKRICTLAIARSLYPEVDSHTLGAMLYRLEPRQEDAREMLKDAHSADADMHMCNRILGRMLADKGFMFSTAEGLWAFSEKCRVPTVIAFGKYKGTPIKDLPYDYKKWMLKQADMDPYVLKAVRDTL